MARSWELISGDYFMDIEDHTVVMETVDEDGLRMQLPVCEIVGEDILNERTDAKKAKKRFVQNARTIVKSLEMLNLLKRVERIISREDCCYGDFDAVRSSISAIVKYTSSSKSIGGLDNERFIDRKGEKRYGRI